MQVRPRLRGLDSTRLLVLVDGERLNNARTATDRAGTEVGLIDLFSVESLEVVSGSGSVLYGTDALAGTINIITNQPKFSDAFAADLRVRRLLEFERARAARHGHAGRQQQAVRDPVRRHDGGLRRLPGRQVPARTKTRAASSPTARSRTSTPSTTTSGSRFRRVPRSVQRALRAHVGRHPDVERPGQQHQRVSGSFALDDRADAAGEVHPAPDGGRRVPGLRAAAVLLARDAAVQQLRPRVRPVRSARADALVHQPAGVRLLAGLEARCCATSSRCSSPCRPPQFFPISVFRLNLTTDTEQHVRTPGLDVQATFVPGPEPRA